MIAKVLHVPRTRRSAALVVSSAAVLALAATQSSAASAASPSFNPQHGYVQANLVSDQPGVAPVTDPNLVNAWGLSHGPKTPLWVSDNGADVSTIYAGGKDGGPVSIVPLVVKIPGGSPTGQVFNDTSQFALSNGMPAFFIFAGEGGTISAWNNALSPITTAERVARKAGGVFKGLALLHRGDFPWLLVADFHNAKVLVYDRTFHRVILPSGAFSDPTLPAGYAPFNVAVLGGRVFVSYALQDATATDDVAGPGFGFVDVYAADGQLKQRFASHGPLNAPWGMTVAPADFGPFSNDVLVGNFGDGRIHAFDPATGHLEGTLRDSTGTPIAIDGLWGLLRGNSVAADKDDVWFTAGPDDEAHGLLGTLRSVGD